MDYATFAGVVMLYSVILISDFFTCTICRRRDCGLAFASADDFNTAMVDSDGMASFLFLLNM